MIDPSYEFLFIEKKVNHRKNRVEGVTTYSVIESGHYTNFTQEPIKGYKWVWVKRDKKNHFIFTRTFLSKIEFFDGKWVSFKCQINEKRHVVHF